MGFGNLNNVGSTPITGFNPNQMLNGFNLGNGIKSSVANFLKKEFKYTEVYNFLIMSSQQLANFDWNATDEEIRAKYKNLNEQLASAWGGVIGRGAGSLAAISLGGVAGLTVPKISGARLASRIVSASSKEAKEEVVDEAVGAIRFTANLGVNVLTLEAYITYRNVLRYKTPEPVLVALFGQDTANFIKYSWGTKDGADFRIAEKIEEKIEKINNQIIKNFVEEATDEFFESFMETGYIIAYELDEALQHYLLANARIEPPEVIEIYPNAENENERYIISSDTQADIEQRTESIINTHRVMESRSIGQVVTQDIEILEQHPQLRQLKIIFRSAPTPPYLNPDGSTARLSVVTIPNLKSGLSWSKIRRTLKYNRNVPSFYFGDSVCTLKFTDKRKIGIKFDHNFITQEAVVSYIKDLSELSNGTMKTITYNEYIEQPRANRDRGEPMYPVEANLVGRDLTDLDRSTANRSPRISYQFPLWTQTEPADFLENFNSRAIS